MFNPFDFKYTHAVVCRIPNSLKEEAYRRKDLFTAQTIDIEKSKEQHNEYILALRWFYYSNFILLIK
jgi:hypothetical protein